MPSQLCPDFYNEVYCNVNIIRNDPDHDFEMTYSNCFVIKYIFYVYVQNSIPNSCYKKSKIVQIEQDILYNALELFHIHKLLLSEPIQAVFSKGFCAVPVFFFHKKIMAALTHLFLWWSWSCSPLAEEQSPWESSQLGCWFV